MQTHKYVDHSIPNQTIEQFGSKKNEKYFQWIKEKKLKHANR